jgi:hypothetical protein
MDTALESSPEVQAAVACAARAARGYSMRAKTFRASVTSVQPRTEEYWRALFLIERRDVVLRMSPGQPGADRRSLRPMPDPTQVDPWSVDSSQLERESRVVTLCPHCQGAKETSCARCQGSARTRCRRCGGDGKVLGERKFLKNCPDCRGKGDVRCSSCRAGRVPCHVCGADGLVAAWLAVEVSTSSLVRSGPENAALHVHRDIASPKDFDAGPQRWPHRLLEDTQTVAALPDHVPAGLLPPLDARTERITQARAQRFQATVFRVNYETAFSKGFLEVSGQPPAVSRSSHTRPLQRRQALLWGTLALSLSSALLFWRAYASVHPWFSLHGAGEAVFWLSLLAAALASLSVARITLPHRTHTPARIWGPLWGTAAVALVTVVLALTSLPSLAHARRALKEGRLPEARTEALALVEIRREVQAAEALLDTLHLQEVRAAPDLATLAGKVRETWYSPQARKEAADRLREQALLEESRLHEKGPPEALEHLALLTSRDAPEVQARAHRRAKLLRAAACLDTGDLPCAVRALRDATQSPEEEYQPLRDRALQALRAHLQAQVKKNPQLPHCERERAWASTLELVRQAQGISPTSLSPSEKELEGLRAAAEKRCAQQRR